MTQSSEASNIQLENAYKNSDIYHKLQASPTKKIAFLDVDGTLTGNANLANKTRELLENNGFAIAMVTTRTEEMLMSQTVYEQSIIKNSFNRPRPNLQSIQGKYAYIQPEKYEPTGILNPEIIIGSTGTQILVRHTNRYYLVDNGYEKAFNFPTNWRNKTRTFLEYVKPLNGLYELPIIDHAETYKDGFADVAPPQYRLGLHFKSSQDKMRFQKIFYDALSDKNIPKEIREHAATLSIINDSHPGENHFKLYLVPQNTNKKSAVDHALSKLQDLFHTDIQHFELLFAGDSLPDLEMGIYAGQGAKATFILSGGSRLTEILTHETVHTFANENLQPIKDRLQEVSPGNYIYTDKKGTRSVVLSDLCTDKIAAASLFEVLNKKYPEK